MPNWPSPQEWAPDGRRCPMTGDDRMTGGEPGAPYDRPHSGNTAAGLGTDGQNGTTWITYDSIITGNAGVFARLIASGTTSSRRRR